METENVPKENGTESSDSVEKVDVVEDKEDGGKEGAKEDVQLKETVNGDASSKEPEVIENEVDESPQSEPVETCKEDGNPPSEPVETCKEDGNPPSEVVETPSENCDKTETPAESTPPVVNGVQEEEKKSTEDISEEVHQSEPVVNEEQNEEEEEDDFNPLLLCPDISMDVEESGVVTAANGPELPSTANDMLDSNSLFAPLFSTFVDEMTGAEISFNLTAEEQQLREKLYGPNNPIQYSKVHCTACNVHLGSALAGQTNRFVHPLLKVLICKECYHFYTSGEFEKDEDGSELYCRWCGQGGQVLCCSKCEFVFCKKCIRINFGRRKLTEVRDSDEWNCFRCDMSQLKALRAMCVEFFEYVRRETARASTVKDPNFINRDLTNCCQTQAKRKLVEVEESEEKEKEAVKEKEPVKRTKRRRTGNDDDPDYNPFQQQKEEEEEREPVPSTSGVKNAIPYVAKQMPPLLPKPANLNAVNFPGKSPSNVIRIGDTVMNVKSVVSGTPIQYKGARTPTTAVRGVAPPLLMRPKNQFAARTPVQTPSPRPTPMPQVRTIAPRSPAPSMKHEWFEKTVRAAARVNSNLSYTLTQLNKAQASASSVEQLAVVHNKLQEILSSSINSLIQIRKNLRTEFIAGIKTIRFPPKPPAADANDDDVIIVNSTPDPKPSLNTLSSLPQLTVKKTLANKIMTVNNAVKTSPASTPTPTPTPSSTTTPTTPTVPARGYIKVKSFSQLQTVSSECITIPDDDPPAPAKDPLAIDPLLSELPTISHITSLSTNGDDKNERDSEIIIIGDETSRKSGVELVDKDKLSNGVQVKNEPEDQTYNVKDKPSPKVRRMLSVKVNLKKTPFVEDKVKQEPVENGN